MSEIVDGKGAHEMWRTWAVTGLAGLLSCGLIATPASAASASTDKRDEYIVSELEVNRGQVENLQRWVAAGHEDWCKDARLVAAHELQRIGADYSNDALELSESETLADGSKRVSFECTSFDGRLTYRVTVERFGWLLPIAEDAEAVVWVPTVIEIRQNVAEPVAPNEDNSSGLGAELIARA